MIKKSIICFANREQIVKLQIENEKCLVNVKNAKEAMVNSVNQSAAGIKKASKLILSEITNIKEWSTEVESQIQVFRFSFRLTSV